MSGNKPPSWKGKIRDLELINWVDENSSMRSMALKDGVKVKERYIAFDDLYAAIIEHGPLVYASSTADVIFVAVSGPFDGDIVAIRQSGRNVRRFLISSDSFDDEYGSFQNCLDHIRSNNAVDAVLELKHLHDMADELKLSATDFEPNKKYDRLEIDIIAALQLLRVFAELYGNEHEISYEFELGFSVGRLFSSAQNMATLEPDARKAEDYERSYRERGKKGKSKDRRGERLDHLFATMEKLVVHNPAMSRLKPIEVAKLASQDAASENPGLWSQGRGQVEKYVTEFASEPKYKKAYRGLFPETG